MHTHTYAHTHAHTHIYNSFIAITTSFMYIQNVCTMFTYSLILITDMLFLAITACIDPGSLNNKT